MRAACASGVTVSVISEKAQSPVAGCVSDELDRVCTQAAAESSAMRAEERSQAEREDRDFHPPAAHDALQRHRLVVLPQIHARVELGHLVGVAVEGQRFPFEELAQAAVPMPGSSADDRPPDSRSNRIRIRCAFEIFHVVGGCFSTNRIFTMDLMLLKPYFHGTTRRSGAPFWLGSTSPYSPTHKIASGCMASSMRKSFNVGKWNAGVPAGRHLLRIVEGLECDELCFRCGLHLLDERVQRKADPGDHDGPGLHASVAVDALFERRHLHDRADVEDLGLIHGAFDGNGPRRGSSTSWPGPRAAPCRCRTRNSCCNV